MPDWTCSICGQLTIRGGEVSRDCVITNRKRIEGHRVLHQVQLEEHDGDLEALKIRLGNPAVHHALTMHPPKPKPEPEPVAEVAPNSFPPGFDYDPYDLSVLPDYGS